VVHTLEAWMPERIAVVKLQGLIHDAGGEVVESIPGLIRVRLPERVAAPPPPRPGLLVSLGFRRPPEPPPRWTEVELHMQKRDDGRQSRLHVTLVIRPGDRARASEPGWQQRCDKIHRDVRAYLIGRT
jgi:serine/threonine-protein kinase